jgi:hypothetical protein
MVIRKAQTTFSITIAKEMENILVFDCKLAEGVEKRTQKVIV